MENTDIYQDPECENHPFRFRATVTLILIVRTPYMTINLVFMEANYIPIFIEIGHSDDKLLNRNHFYIFYYSDLQLSAPYPIPKSTCMQTNYIPSFVDTGHS